MMIMVQRSANSCCHESANCPATNFRLLVGLYLSYKLHDYPLMFPALFSDISQPHPSRFQSLLRSCFCPIKTNDSPVTLKRKTKSTLSQHYVYCTVSHATNARYGEALQNDAITPHHDNARWHSS